MEPRVEQLQDEISFRRITTYELQRLTEEVRDLKEREQQPRQMSWWIPAVFSIIMAGVSGYIGIVHNLALQNADVIDRTRDRFQAVADEVQRRATLRPDLDNVKERLLYMERFIQQIPHLQERVNAQAKDHEQLERRFEHLYKSGDWGR